MIYKTKLIGQEIIKIPALGQGTTGTGRYDEIDAERDLNRIRVLRYGIDLGMTLIDTAEIYGGGHAEELVGRAIEGQRTKVFLCSKFNPEHNKYLDVLTACENSLRRLRVNYLDLYQLHWPNPHIPIAETIVALKALQRAGKIKHIGLSNVSLADIKIVEQMTNLFSVQMEYNLFDRTVEADILPYCQKQEILFIAYSPLDQGRPKIQLNQFSLHKYLKTPAQLVLNWLIMHQAVVAIPKTTSLEHTQENADATSFELTPEDRQLIDQIFTQEIVMISPDQIEIATADDRPVYKTKEEAIENKWDYVPSSVDLAQSLILNKYMKPVRLKRNEQGKYDLIGGRIRYWGWRIAFDNEPMPALIES